MSWPKGKRGLRTSSGAVLAPEDVAGRVLRGIPLPRASAPAGVRILALDLGDTTGWTRLYGEDLRSDVLDMSVQINEHPGLRWPRARRLLRDLAEGCTHVAWEKIISGAFGQGGFAKSTLYGLEVQVVEVCAVLGLEPITVAPPTLKKFATGSGRATKNQMRDAGRDRWPGVTFPTHDAIDARWIYEWAVAALAAASKEGARGC